MIHRFRFAFVLAAMLSLTAAMAPSGCAVSGTGGELVELEIGFVGATRDGAALGVGTTLYDPGWEIELDEARLVVGGAYVFPPTPVASALLPFLPSAHAHAGDDNLFAVTALAEWREQVVVDALSPEVQLTGPFLGEAGEVGAASVWIDSPRGELAGPDGPTRGHHGWVAGTARRDGETIRFEAGLTLEDTPLSQRVDRISIAPGAAVEESSRVVFEVFAGQWLQQVDFDALRADGVLEPDSDGVVRAVEPHPLQRAWLIDFHDPDAFAVGVQGANL
ncbi:MAG: hypothetical protein AB8I08_38460 [Sandaracinaceae bacterium]